MIPAAVVGRALFPLHERLKGKPTFHWLARLEHSQWWPPDRLREYQLERLRTLLQFAYDRVPYYRRLLDEHELPPARLKSLDDLTRIPPLTREALREHFTELQARPAPRRTQSMSTGGSTGAPVTVLVDMQRMGFVEAARLRAHRWFGLEPGVREVVFWGSPIELTRQDRVRGLRDRLLNSRLLSAFDLGEAALARYGRLIQRYEPVKMYGYASALYRLARYLEASGWTPPRSLRAIFTTAEPLFDFQRRVIEAVFGCPVAVEYGARDAGLIGTECPRGSLHIPAEGMHVEILGDRGDGIGEVVVTNLDSHAFPIIRYRTGDIAAAEPASCRCGRGLPRLRGVEGRQTDFLVTPDGRCLHALAVIYVLRDTPSVREFQVVQESVDRLTVFVVVNSAFSSDDAQALQTRLRSPLGTAMTITIQPVAAIDRAASGKFRHVVSNVAGRRLDAMVTRATE